jgi:hypothetical protein
MSKLPPDVQAILRDMAADSGVKEYGGRVMRNLAGDAVGRTVWIGQPEWCKGFGYSKAQIVAIVEKAIAGRKLGKRQALLLESMLSDIPPPELCDRWHTMRPDEKEAALDEIFGADSREESAAECAPVATGPVTGTDGEKSPALRPGRPDQPGKADRHLPAPDRNDAQPGARIYAMPKSKDKRPIGRPAIPGRRVVIKLPEELIRRAERLGDGFVAAGIRRALKESIPKDRKSG